MILRDDNRMLQRDDRLRGSLSLRTGVGKLHPILLLVNISKGKRVYDLQFFDMVYN